LIKFFDSIFVPLSHKKCWKLKEGNYRKKEIKKERKKGGEKTVVPFAVASTSAPPPRLRTGKKDKELVR
jgi:hypothetical protein